MKPGPHLALLVLAGVLGPGSADAPHGEPPRPEMKTYQLALLREGKLVFRNMEASRIDELVARDPAIAAGCLELDLHAWRIPAGTLPPR